MTLRFFPILLIVPFVACSTKKPIKRGPDPLETMAGFCQSWAEAACGDQVLKYCATNVSDCRDSQAEFCESRFDRADYDRTNAEDCLKAVERAFSDGDLETIELNTVRNLQNECAGLVNGMGEEGDDCEKDSDCNFQDDLVCVFRIGEGGTCQEPEEAKGGYECNEPQIVCEDGFYCDGENCLRQKENGAPCSLSMECREGMYCLLDSSSSGEGGAGSSAGEGTCVNKRQTGDDCDENQQCKDGSMCLLVGDDPGECVEIVRLSRSEPICKQELS